MTKDEEAITNAIQNLLDEDRIDELMIITAKLLSFVGANIKFTGFDQANNLESPQEIIESVVMASYEILENNGININNNLKGNDNGTRH